jgi:hypothetical protein
VPRILAALFYVGWVFLGNFMLLNLFLAVLLDSFTEDEDEEENNGEKKLDPQK